jgi:hypothetical protein
MTHERERFLICLIHLMQQEIACLRSVLSEFEGDKREYTQMVRAEIFRAAIETMEHQV